MSKSTPNERRKAGDVLAKMVAEMEDAGASLIGFYQESSGEQKWVIYFDDCNDDAVESFADTLDDAFINALHKLNGTTPPPF